MSDGEPSSIKRLTRCAARAPALSKRYEDRVEARFDFAVYGTRFAAHQFYIRTSPVKFLRILCCSSKAARLTKSKPSLCFLRCALSAKKFAQASYSEYSSFKVVRKEKRYAPGSIQKMETEKL